MNDIKLRYEAAELYGMKQVGMVGGLPLFDGTPEQFEQFHNYLQKHGTQSRTSETQ